tara:strand:+ start:402 stop:515 length:114 start_codon:yes stop_codon:yes gene_type:complete
MVLAVSIVFEIISRPTAVTASAVGRKYNEKVSAPKPN